MYLEWNKQTINDFSDKNINALYDAGFLFTREGKGAMYETRSVRVNLSKFELSSENRRVLRKTENIKMEVVALPYEKYSWEIGKLGKDFYETKFGEGTFSANKIKELTTGATSNFNLLLIYSTPVILSEAKNPLTNDKGSFADAQDDNVGIGYAICLETKNILHYCYPFYDLASNIPNLGISMMTQAIVWAKEQNKKYVYLGSAKDEAALYKTQFKGFDWWDGKIWQTDVEELKNILK